MHEAAAVDGSAHDRLGVDARLDHFVIDEAHPGGAVLDLRTVDVYNGLDRVGFVLDHCSNPPLSPVRGM